MRWILPSISLAIGVLGVVMIALGVEGDGDGWYCVATGVNLGLGFAGIAWNVNDLLNAKIAKLTAQIAALESQRDPFSYEALEEVRRG
jgi:hypothetical protein